LPKTRENVPGSKHVAFTLAALAAAYLPRAFAQPTESDVPQYQVDPSWPKQLPYNWIMGQVGGMSIDDQDHIWVLQRPRPRDRGVGSGADTAERPVLPQRSLRAGIRRERQSDPIMGRPGFSRLQHSRWNFTRERAASPDHRLSLNERVMI